MLGIIVDGFKAVVSVISKLAISMIDIIGPAIMALCKALGLVKDEEKLDEMGDKAIQAEESGIKLENYSSFQEYMEAIDNFPLDPEKSKSISYEEKMRRGPTIASCGLQEKFPNAPVAELIRLVSEYPLLFTERKFTELGSLLKQDPKSLEGIVDFLNGKAKNDIIIDQAVNSLKMMSKSENPNISDKEIIKEIMHMRK